MDEEIEVQVTAREGHYAIVCFLDDLIQNIQQKHILIDHFTISVKTEDQTFGVKLDSLTDDKWQESVPHFKADQFAIRLNLRAQAPTRILLEIVCESIEVLCWNVGATCLGKNTKTSHLD